MKNPKKLNWGWASYRDLENGMMQWELYSRLAPIPTCVVWGFAYRLPTKIKETVFFVMGSFTPHWARRRGARTRLHAEMAKSYKAVVTFGGTPDSGLPFLKALGAKKLRPWGLWEYPKAEKKK